MSKEERRKLEDVRKIWVGGLGDLPEIVVKKYFLRHGKVDNCMILKDKSTGKSQGFGFVLFGAWSNNGPRDGPKERISGENVVARLLEKEHEIDRHKVVIKKVTAPGEPPPPDTPSARKGQRDIGPPRGDRGGGGRDRGRDSRGGGGRFGGGRFGGGGG